MMNPTEQAHAFAELANTQDEYVSRATENGEFSDKLLLCLEGATADGKTTIMQLAAQKDPRFCIVPTITTRELAPRDDPNLVIHYSHELFLAETHSRKLAQIAIFPGGAAYATHSDDYRTPFCTKEVLTSAVPGFYRMGFKQLFEISVVPSDPLKWLERAEIRWPIGNASRESRFRESIQSREYALDQENLMNHFWLINPEGDPQAAAQMLIDIALGNSEGSDRDTAQDLARVCIELARGVLDKPS